MRGPAEKLLAQLRDAPLMRLSSGRVLGHAEGFIPRLVAWTQEDKAAKGLRSLKARTGAPEPPVHFSVLEVMQEHRCTLLLAEAGGGRTALARHLALHFAGELVGDDTFGLRGLAVDLPRNDLGDVRADGWRCGAPWPHLIAATTGMRIADALPDGGGDGDSPDLLIIDDVETIREGWRRFCADLDEALASRGNLRILLLGDRRTMTTWPLPPVIARYDLLPLLAAQRRLFAARAQASEGAAALSAAASSPALFALAQTTDAEASTAEDILDGWIDRDADVEAPWARSRLIEELISARELAAKPIAEAAALFHADPLRWSPVLASLLRRLSSRPAELAALIDLLLAPVGDAGYRGAMLAGRAAGVAPQQMMRVAATLCRLVATGALTPLERVEAGRILAVHGDPRDLEALADVAGGAFTMGSATHPTSNPPHSVSVPAFRIGVHPVTNAAYAAFVDATGRPWPSCHGRLPERVNMPATDLTWHDARAYCAWMTARWRAAGRIHSSEVVRLPSEPEWERAARGDRPDGGDAAVYPWEGGWSDAAANAEPLGLNDTCAVGLFPAGRSPFGCLDMAGQVWEWCTTLWGEDMAAPSFAYPYREDGREDAEAPDGVRRVLRGGCFSSGPAKACVSYRGSLEANGFWRGNGFRIVVARQRGPQADQP